MRKIAVGRKLFVLAGALVPTLVAFFVPIRPAAASAPSCRYSYDANLATVRDNVTGLTWSRTTAPGAYNRSDAVTFCAGLGAGWRVPSLEELLTIVDLSAYAPAADTSAFPDQGPGNYMTSTDFGDDPTQTWWVDFNDGETLAISKGQYASLRCVK